MSKSKKKTTTRKKRQYTQNPLVHDPGLKCPHCENRHGHRKAHKYPNGRQRMLCGSCGRPFVVWRD